MRSWILNPLAQLEPITSRHDAVEWFLFHRQDPAVVALKQSLRVLPDVDGRAAAIVHGRSKPKEFVALCRTWLAFSTTCQQFRSYFSDGIFPILF